MVRPLPDDDKNTKEITFRNVLDTRYLEVFVVGGNAITKKIEGYTYNTIGLNGMGKTGNSAPQNLVDKLDVKQIKKDFHAFRAFLNGPRVWCLDWINVPVGASRNFNGLEARWEPTPMNIHEEHL